MTAYCPRCRQAYDRGERFCPQDGERLVRQLPGDELPFRLVEETGEGDPLETAPSFPTFVHHDANGLSGDDLLAPGAMLGSLYRVVGLIGRGSMGSVYEVEHVRLRKPFAAKVLRRALSKPEHVQRLEREAVAASHIEHPGIVRVVNFDETASGRVFMVSELLAGHDLGKLLQVRGALPLDVALAIAGQVTSALQAAHEGHVVHRDLKPENIYLSQQPDGVLVKVLDFGVSKVRYNDEDIRITDLGMVLGTPTYMSPENADGDRALDHRADIYSLGVILYEMVTGTVPFAGGKPLQVLVKHLEEEPDPPSARKRGLPRGVDAVVLKALEKDPDARYRTMGELAEALEKLGAALSLRPAPIPLLSEEEAAASGVLRVVDASTTVMTRGAGRGSRLRLLLALLAAACAGAFAFWLRDTQ